MPRTETRTGGRPAATGVIAGRGALSVGNPASPTSKGFRWIRLTDVARLESGHTPSRSKPEYWNGDVPWIGIRDATGNHGRVINKTKQWITNEGLANSSARLLPAGTVCLSRTASVGYVVTMGVPMATSQDFVNWVCGPGISSAYLRYLFLAEQETIRRFAHGSTHQTVYFPEAKAFHVCIPERREQDAIAEVFGALDDRILLNERIRETALGLAGACYEAADFGGEPELIGDVAELFDGPHATPQKTESGPWFLSISSLKNGYLDLSESAHLSEEDFPRWTRRVQPQAGDVLFSYETRLGDAALMPRGIRGSLGRRMALLRSKCATVSGSLLLHAYLSPAFQEEIKRRTVHGATVDRLPLKEMPGWRILLPAEGERERLSAKLDALHASVMQGANENRTLADLRDTLLPQLLSGKLRVKDAVRTVEEVV
ncbi:restriction endonuclease subunit S [Streptomyces sp. NPDC090073]|uniref:restriction endonuclease subunit S n=1 Tax=Streptomyces sp. NPDC090073 TaxID=3365936 RepID=UPI00382CCB7D